MNEDRWDEDEADEADDDEDTTIPCPYCRRSIYEDSERCPHCGNYLTGEAAPQTRKPWWIILGVLAAFYVIYRWIAG